MENKNKLASSYHEDEISFILWRCGRGEGAQQGLCSEQVFDTCCLLAAGFRYRYDCGMSTAAAQILLLVSHVGGERSLKENIIKPLKCGRPVICEKIRKPIALLLAVDCDPEAEMAPFPK